MSNYYDIESDRPYNSGPIGNTDVPCGIPVSESSMGVIPATYDSGVDGFALNPQSSDAASDDDNDTGYRVYHSDEDDIRVIYGCNTEGDVVKSLAIGGDVDGSATASIQHGDTVGVIDTSSSDAPDISIGLVQEGYSNGTTTFNQSNDNFLPVGVADVEDGETVDGSLVTFTVERRTEF